MVVLPHKRLQKAVSRSYQFDVQGRVKTLVPFLTLLMHVSDGRHPVRSGLERRPLVRLAFRESRLTTRAQAAGAEGNATSNLACDGTPPVLQTGEDYT